ncbi:MAG: L,D-transpeptidase family protein [Verrucomicrobiota bacterium]|nr:L,D-transpeptidase family protein [Verrucomicrobiota bacterium]
MIFKNSGLPFLISICLVLLITGCETTRPKPKVVQSPQGVAAPVQPKYGWTDQSAAGPVTVEIDRASQRMSVMRNGQEVGWSRVSTGREGYSTPAGVYKVSSKRANHHSTLYGSFVNAEGKIVDSNAKSSDTPPAGTTYKPAPMPFFMRLTDDGVGMHEGFIPNFPASHGCIRLPKHFAETLFNSISVGTPVTIK